MLEMVAIKSLDPKIGESARNNRYKNTRSKICSVFESTVLQVLVSKLKPWAALVFVTLFK